MKVCFVTTNFPRYPDDSEGTFIWQAVQAVARRGHQVRVIAQHWPGWPARERWDGVEIIRPRYWWPESGEMLRQEGGGLPIVWRKSRLARLQIIPFSLAHTLAVARYARDCDAIHAQWTLSAGAAWLSRAAHRRPILATLQGSDIFRVTSHPLGAWLTRLVLRHCQHISALSQALATAAAAAGVPDSLITVIPNGVDTTLFKPPSQPREQLILYVGTLIQRKGVNYLLEAMAQVTRRFPSFRLAIVGEGPEESALKQSANQLGIAGQVTFVGPQSPEQVRQWMQRAMLFVLPSLEEGLGVVLLEALACGTPIVASQVGGIPDVVTPDVGRLVPAARPEALAEAINQLLADQSLWASMSHKARERATGCYDWQQIARRFEVIYKEIAAA